MNEQSHPDCEACRADKEREQTAKRLSEEYAARRKADRDTAKETMLNTIMEKYGLNEEDSYDIYYLWNEFEEWWG